MLRRTTAVQPIRSYHYDADIYGFRTARKVVPHSYQPAEVQNRNRNPNLLRLVYAYRNQGHLKANLDPLNLTFQNTVSSAFDPVSYGISEGLRFDLAGIVHVGKTNDPSVSRNDAKIETVIKHLENSY